MGYAERMTPEPPSDATVELLRLVEDGAPQVDMAGLEQLLVRFSELVVEQPAIAELDINPLLASPGRLLALDARVILHDVEALGP